MTKIQKLFQKCKCDRVAYIPVIKDAYVPTTEGLGVTATRSAPSFGITKGDEVLWMHTGYRAQDNIPTSYSLWVGGYPTHITPVLVVGGKRYNETTCEEYLAQAGVIINQQADLMSICAKQSRWETLKSWWSLKITGKT